MLTQDHLDLLQKAAATAPALYCWTPSVNIVAALNQKGHGDFSLYETWRNEQQTLEDLLDAGLIADFKCVACRRKHAGNGDMENAAFRISEKGQGVLIDT